MIKFFRKIRQRLLSDNKFSKYLIYAVGEIILVVIGILIALQVNNLNEVRKSNLELNKINQNLIQEFESNQKALNIALGGLKWTKRGGLKILSMMGKSESELNRTNIDSLIETSLFWPTWKPTNFVLNELKSTGKLSLIKNNKIKELLFEYERQSENVNEWNRRMEKSSQDIVDYIKNYGSLRNVNHNRISIKKSDLDFNNISFFNDLKFENQVDEKVLYSQFLENVYAETDKLISEILEETRK
ncbi:MULTISPECIES: hypothetical protein [Flavobacteriaceae]|jgi:hypothetical protein|uniref:Uncharacterized protein n=3 Tax=Flavobacteriaceae TaxID=49546 RepID=A0A370Q2F7_9FLAO|nr:MULTISPECIES: hypothetical protein [Flavobacteriaceae]RDK82541.1 hypothetical protein C8D94_1194 [Marinirhabdus gelatinilytica]WGF94022.1 hypothetical protein QCQ61_07470 [Aequorivita sp. Ant34-E75]